MLIGFWFSELTYKALKTTIVTRENLIITLDNVIVMILVKKKSNVLAEWSWEIQGGEDVEESEENSNLLNGELGYYLKLMD